MRTSQWAVLVGLCLVGELVCVESGRAQSMLFPVGQPYTFAAGFSGTGSPAPSTLSATNNISNNTLVVLPQQQVGMVTPLWRNLMIFPNHNTINGVSPLPPPSSFPGASFFNNLNPFAKVGH
jgi:hypothetical protein